MLTAQNDLTAFDSLINQYPTIWEEIKNISYSAQEKAKNEAVIAVTELVKGKLNDPTIDPKMIALELMPLD
jgi:hypothetical protein